MTTILRADLVAASPALCQPTRLERGHMIGTLCALIPSQTRGGGYCTSWVLGSALLPRNSDLAWFRGAGSRQDWRIQPAGFSTQPPGFDGPTKGAGSHTWFFFSFPWKSFRRSTKGGTGRSKPPGMARMICPGGRDPPEPRPRHANGPGTQQVDSEFASSPPSVQTLATSEPRFPRLCLRFASGCLTPTQDRRRVRSKN